MMIEEGVGGMLLRVRVMMMMMVSVMRERMSGWGECMCRTVFGD